MQLGKDLAGVTADEMANVVIAYEPVSHHPNLPISSEGAISLKVKPTFVYQHSGVHSTRVFGMSSTLWNLNTIASLPSIWQFIEKKCC